MQPVFRLPPDWKVTPALTPLSEVVDPFQELLGVADLQKRNAGIAYRGTPQQRPVRFAVLDTGCDLNHNDLKSQLVDAADFTGSRFGPEDRNDHGTWCCGAIAAAANDFGVRGIAYEARLLSAKVLGDNGSGDDASIANGLRWAYVKGADVFSLSLGGGRMSESLRRMFLEVSQQPGKFIFCASGNDGGRVNYPAAWPETIAVGAVDKNGQLTKFTSRGPQLDILAPGVEILSTISGNKHGTMTGTSMATPIAAAIGGLVWAQATSSGNTERLDTKDEMIELLRSRGNCSGEVACQYPVIDPRMLATAFVPDAPADGGDGPDEVHVFIGGVCYRSTNFERA